MLFLDAGDVSKVCLGHYLEMLFCLRVNVFERSYQIIFVAKCVFVLYYLAKFTDLTDGVSALDFMSGDFRAKLGFRVSFKKPAG